MILKDFFFIKNILFTGVEELFAHCCVPYFLIQMISITVAIHPQYTLVVPPPSLLLLFVVHSLWFTCFQIWNLQICKSTLFCKVVLYVLILNQSNIFWFIYFSYLQLLLRYILFLSMSVVCIILRAVFLSFNFGNSITTG